MKLGMFLRDVSELRQQHRPNHEVKPTIIIGPADAHNECLIVAVTKESFGNSLQQTQVLRCLAPLPDCEYDSRRPSGPVCISAQQYLYWSTAESRACIIALA